MRRALFDVDLTGELHGPVFEPISWAI